MATLIEPDRTDPKLEREVVLVRRLKAPRALVFRTLTEPEHITRWWGPHGFTAPECVVDLRVGGQMRIVMQGPDGARFPMTAVIDELAPPERFAYRFETGHAAGILALRGRNLLVLAERDGETELTITAHAEGLIPEAAFMLQGMEIGWSQTLDRLAAQFA